MFRGLFHCGAVLSVGQAGLIVSDPVAPSQNHNVFSTVRLEAPQRFTKTHTVHTSLEQ